MRLIDKLIQKHELRIDQFTGDFLIDKDELQKICNDYKIFNEESKCVCDVPELPIGFTSMDRRDVKCVKCSF
jgi:hypothetical protein